MRISNIKNYLGGADNVTVEEINQGDQLVWNITFGDGQTPPLPTNLENHTFTLKSELFTANVISRGSKIIIEDLAKVANTTVNTYPASNATKATDNLSLNVLIPSTLLSDLDSVVAAAPDSTTPYIVVLGITANDGATPSTKTTFRTMWIIRYTPQ